MKKTRAVSHKAGSNQIEIASRTIAPNTKPRVRQDGLWRPANVITTAPEDHDNDQARKTQTTTSAAISAKVLRQVESNGRAVLLEMERARQNKDKLQSPIAQVLRASAQKQVPCATDLAADVSAILANHGVDNQILLKDDDQALFEDQEKSSSDDDAAAEALLVMDLRSRYSVVLNNRLRNKLQDQNEQRESPLTMKGIWNKVKAKRDKEKKKSVELAKNDTHIYYLNPALIDDQFMQEVFDSLEKMIGSFINTLQYKIYPHNSGLAVEVSGIASEIMLLDNLLYGSNDNSNEGWKMKLDRYANLRPGSRCCSPPEYIYKRHPHDLLEVLPVDRNAHSEDSGEDDRTSDFEDDGAPFIMDL